MSYLTAWPQDKFLPARFTPMSIRYTGLNMLPNSFLSVRGKILGFPSKDSNYISNSKKK